MKNIYDCYTLNNGVSIPCVGYGTYKAADGDSAEVIRTAIEAGYRYFDTASFYGTEEYLGEAIQESKIPRKDFFIASKVWKAEMGYENVKKAFGKSLEKLKTDYLDLYLIHWPLPEENYGKWKELDLDTWRGMEELYHAGRVRAIGVSNFLPHHLQNLLDYAEVKPAVDQVEFHPGYTQEATVQYCQERGIQVQAWSPIGRMRIVKEPLLVEMAKKYGVSPVQICLRYALQRKVIPLPKSSSMERMKQNQNLFGFEIEQEDMWRLTTLPVMGWSGEHPDRYRVKVLESTERYDL
ncbi:MAG: aldo/keto reductase [Hespellia sp.]|nr:aldo/keto reductase [Hespellia sp.]